MPDTKQVFVPEEVEAIKAIVHEELASMGGDLASTYGTVPATSSEGERRRNLAAIGGYLLQRFGRR